MEDTKKNIKAALFVVIPVILIVMVIVLVKKYMPSREIMDLEKYYPVETNDVLLITQDKIFGKVGKIIGGEVYIDLDTVTENFNKRFYFDENENLLIYTTATEVTKAEVGSSDYYVNKSKVSVNYPIVKVENGVVYIALEYIETFSALETKLYEKPNRLVCKYQFDKEYEYADVKKETKLRSGASIKEPILATLEKNAKVTVLGSAKDGEKMEFGQYDRDKEEDSSKNTQTSKANSAASDDGTEKKGNSLILTARAAESSVDESEKGGQKEKAEADEKENKKSKFVKIMTEDGIIGFAERKRLSEIQSQKDQTDFKEPVYPSISKDYKINLVFHQTTTQDANNNLLNLLDATKGVNTVVPTWFSIANNKGEITSLANDTYVSRAHNAGVEVWGLCDDFDKENVNMKELLSRTSSREKLANELIAAAIKHELDGINIDFERVTESAGKDFIQFIRELSIKCRSNGIVLSIDNYPPGYTAYYDREEQGIVADYVITMAYDEYNGASEESGPVASIQYVADAIENTMKEVPGSKMIVAVPFYSRLWKEEKSGGETKVSSQAYGMQTGMNVLTDHGVTLEWQEDVGMNYGEFEADDSLYRMWIEDEKSMELKMKAISEAKTAGVAAWKLGLEKPAVWDVIIKYVN